MKTDKNHAKMTEKKGKRRIDVSKLQIAIHAMLYRFTVVYCFFLLSLSFSIAEQGSFWAFYLCTISSDTRHTYGFFHFWFDFGIGFRRFPFLLPQHWSEYDVCMCLWMDKEWASENRFNSDQFCLAIPFTLASPWATIFRHTNTSRKFP